MGITIDHSWVKYVAKCTENCIAQQFFMSNLLSESIQNCKFWYQVYFNKCKHSARSNVSDFEILWFWNYNEGKDVPHIFQENQTHRCLSLNYRYITNYMYISTKIFLLSSRNRVYGEVDSIKKQSKQKLEQNLSCLNTRSTWKIYRVLSFLWWTIHIIWH